MGDLKCTLDEVVAAIDGSSGIKSVIGRRLGVTRQTVSSYLNRWATARQAYEQEKKSVLDLAESVVIRNIQLARKQQEDTKEPANSSDARWILTMKGRERGYASTTRLEGVLANLDLSKLTDDQISRLAKGEDPVSVLADTATG